MTISYSAAASSAVESVASLGLQASFSSREIVTPRPANAAGPASLAELTSRIADVPGVATADQLSFVDLAPGALGSGSRQVAGPVRLFGFDDRYRQHDASIRIVSGSYQPGHGLLSAEAARALSAGPGDVVQVDVPGRDKPLPVRISGITDLSRARSLFYSRQGQQLEQFVYLHNTVVVEPEVFAEAVVPAFQKAETTRGDVIKSRPILEVDIAVERDRLDADPGTALAQTRAVAGAVSEVAPGQDALVDNISNTSRWPATTPARPSACSCSSACPAPCSARSWPRTPAASWPAPSGASRRSCASAAPTAATWCGCTPCARLP